MDNRFSKKESIQLKGLAILIMMFHHCFATADRFAGYSISFSPFAQGSVVAVGFYSKICVSMFAFVTGYGLYLSVRNLQKDGRTTSNWVRKRLIKLIGGFLFIYLLSFVVCQLYAGLPAEVYGQQGHLRAIGFVLIDALGLAGIVGTPMLNPTWWYMSAAILYIVFVPVAYACAERVGLFPLMLLVMALPRLLNVGYPDGTNPYTFLTPVMIGMMFAEHDVFGRLQKINETQSTAVKSLLFVLWCVVLYCGVYFCIHFAHDIVWEVHYGFMPMLIIVFAWKYVLRIPGLNALLGLFGKYSMTIFLTHTFIRYHFCADFVYGQRHFLLVVVVLTVSSLLLAIVVDALKKLVQWDRLVGYVMEKMEDEGNRSHRWIITI